MTDTPTVYIVSDLHMGAGYSAATNTWDVLEDFKADDSFCAFLDHISAEPGPVELVIAGDFIEYLQILPQIGLQSPVDHLGTTEEQSFQRTLVVLGQSNVASGHPKVFARMRQFLHDGHDITILAGNHDVDMLWNDVWLLLRYNIAPPGAKGRLCCKPFNYVVGNGDKGRVYIEHGHEHDRKNSFGNQMENPFGFDANNVKRLKRNWGTLFVDKVFNQLEEQYSFIDNVKPIARVIKLGITGDIVYTATALALITRFFLANNPLMGVSYGVPGMLGEESATETDPEQAVDMVEDEELRAYIKQRLHEEPAMRQAFEQELEAVDTETQEAMQAMQSNVEAQPFNEIEGDEEPPEMLSFGLGGQESPYRQAAREVMENDPSIRAVVMGHTHGAINGQTDPIHLSNGNTGYYYNSGTWTPHLRERDTEYTWEDLKDASNYISSLDYLRLVPDGNGGYDVELRSWQDEQS